MSDASNMETIVALLENLIERVEGIEKRQGAMKEALLILSDHSKKRGENDQKLREAMYESFCILDKKLTDFVTRYDMDQRKLPTEHESAKRHGEINEWTGDLSRKLSEMQSTLDKIGGQKRGIFG